MGCVCMLVCVCLLANRHLVWLMLHIVLLPGRSHPVLLDLQPELACIVLILSSTCGGAKGISPKELAEFLRCIAEAPLDEQLRGELKDLFNQKLSTDPYMSWQRPTLTKVDFPENYLRQVDWDKLMDSHSDVSCKLVHLCNFGANLGLQHPTEKSAKDIAALASLTEQELVIAGPMGVHYVRTFKKHLREFALSLRAVRTCS